MASRRNGNARLALMEEQRQTVFEELKQQDEGLPPLSLDDIVARGLTLGESWQRERWETHTYHHSSS